MFSIQDASCIGSLHDNESPSWYTNIHALFMPMRIAS